MSASLRPIATRVESGDIFLRAKTQSFSQARSSTAKPVSEDSDDLDTDFEDGSDLGDAESFDSGLESEDSRRKSNTTMSSYEEVPTPDSSRSGRNHRPFDIMIKPIQGPRGPHLFRESALSADFDEALQLSPMLPKEVPQRTGTSISLETVTSTTRLRQQDFSIASVLAAPEPTTDDLEAEIKQWNPSQVVDWMYSSGVDESILEALEVNDIDGAILLTLSFDDLREQLDIQSFGKRLGLWKAICSLRGEEATFSPQPTPFQDISRPCTTNTKRSPRIDHQSSADEEATPISPSSGKKRRGRKPQKLDEIVSPAESVSIVAIEQLLPKPHKCNKGERCAKWRKQQRELQQLQDENGIGRFPISPTKGGHIYITGDPGNATTAANIIPNVRRQTEMPLRDAMPSVAASSNLLSPGQMPEFALHETMLGQLGNRDPQDNVQQFLSLQHMYSPTEETPPSPPGELAEAGSIPRSTSVPAMFPAHHYQPYPSVVPPRNVKTPGPNENLRSLPRLDIPRPATAAPKVSNTVASPTVAASACRSATASPAMVFRLGSPQSEVDVPVPNMPTSPVAREASQSVPPNMQLRQPLHRSPASRTDLRRPSMPLAAVKEGEIYSPASSDAQSMSTTRRGSGQSGKSSRPSYERSTSDPARYDPSVKHFGYGAECTHAGYMKKRKTKMLRHEWQEAHCRLIGSQLSMHENARLNSTAVEKINVDNYGISCSTAASNGKLSAAMKAFHINNGADGAKADSAAFNFQLVPNREAEKKVAASGKTHHFAVKTKDERIDWMRELMLAQALQQKGKGYDVEVNGERF